MHAWLSGSSFITCRSDWYSITNSRMFEVVHTYSLSDITEASWVTRSHVLAAVREKELALVKWRVRAGARGQASIPTPTAVPGSNLPRGGSADQHKGGKFCACDGAFALPEPWRATLAWLAMRGVCWALGLPPVRSSACRNPNPKRPNAASKDHETVLSRPKLGQRNR